VRGAVLAAAAMLAAAAHAANPASWTQDQPPFRIHGDTYYVGSQGLASILVVSPEGDVLIDGDLPESASKIATSVRALGFRLEDVKLILNSHVHFDHAGGIAELQRITGARVLASEPSAAVLRAGGVGRGDPQEGLIPGIAPTAEVEVVKDGETVRVGPIELTAHVTAGHTPGGTTWTWKSCEKARCVNVVYADSLTPIAARGYLFSDSAHRATLAGFARSYETLRTLPCDLLITPHPEVSDFWGRIARRVPGDADALVDPTACVRLAASAHEQLERRLDAERAGRVR